MWSAWRASKKPADADLGDATPPDDPELETAVKPRTARKTTKPTTTKKATTSPGGAT